MFTHRNKPFACRGVDISANSTTRDTCWAGDVHISKYTYIRCWMRGNQNYLADHLSSIQTSLYITFRKKIEIVHISDKQIRNPVHGFLSQRTSRIATSVCTYPRVTVVKEEHDSIRMTCGMLQMRIWDRKANNVSHNGFGQPCIRGAFQNAKMLLPKVSHTKKVLLCVRRCVGKESRSLQRKRRFVWHCVHSGDQVWTVMMEQ